MEPLWCPVPRQHAEYPEKGHVPRISLLTPLSLRQISAPTRSRSLREVFSDSGRTSARTFRAYRSISTKAVRRNETHCGATGGPLPVSTERAHSLFVCASRCISQIATSLASGDNCREDFA